MSAKPSPALRVLTATNQQLSKVSHISCLTPRNEVAVLNVDGNNLSTLNGIESYPALIQLSACDNSLVRIDALRFTANLVTLNLQGNSISEVAGLEGLVNLQWVSLASNTIVNMSGLGGCVKLNYLDLSDNCITELSDITSLSSLKTLLLHGNAISSLQSVPKCLPDSLLTLSLAENEVADLNEASFLRSLSHLEQLSLLNNPCVSITDARIFDFRPYVLFWRPTLTVLDGVEITAEERQSSRTLFPPEQPYPFSLGEHHILVHYLSSIYSVPSIPMADASKMLGTSKIPDASKMPGASRTLDSSKLVPHAKMSDAPLLPNASQMSDSAEKKLTSLPAGEKTTTTSLVELEGLLAQSSSSDHSGLISKLRALQLVEEMIAAQQELISAEAGAKGGATELPAETRKVEPGFERTGLINGDTSLRSTKTQSVGKSQGVKSAGFVTGSSVQGPPSDTYRGHSPSGRKEQKISTSPHSALGRKKESNVPSKKKSDLVTTAPQSSMTPHITSAPRSTVAPHTTSSAPRSTVAPHTTSPAPQSTVAPHTASSAPQSTVAPHTASPAPRSTVAPHTTSPVPRSTVAPHTASSAPRSTVAPHTTSSAPRSTVAPHTTSSAPQSTVAPHTTSSAPRSTVAPHTTSSAPQSTVAPHTTSPAPQSTVAHSHTVEQGYKQLLLLNEKLAQRHSKIPRRDITSKTLPQTTVVSSSKSADFQSSSESVLLSASKSDQFQSPTSMGGVAFTGSKSATLRSPSGGVALSASKSAESPTASTSVSLLSSEVFSIQSTGDGRNSASVSMVAVDSKTQHMEPILSWELPGKSVALQPRPEPMIPLATLPSLPASGPQSEAFVGIDPLPDLHLTAELSLLESETSYLPVLPSDSSIPEPDSQDTDVCVSSLLTSLDSAYGYTSLTEKSRLLTSLVGGAGEVGVASLQHGASELTDAGIEDLSLVSHSVLVTVPDLDPTWAAVRIQTAYRGYVCRNKFRKLKKEVRAATLIQASWRGYISRKRDPQVLMVRSEISRVKVEAFAHTLHWELEQCKQKLSQQVRLARLQEDTLQTLLSEVKELQQWRAEVQRKEREKAALLLQKYWRGHMARKRYPHIPQILRQRRQQYTCPDHFQTQLTQLQHAVSGLRSSVAKNSDVPPDPSEDLPAVQDLQMSHHSDACILLHWSPPPPRAQRAGSRADSPGSRGGSGQERIGFRVYVNGVAEGMVGPEKSKAYIEGLDVNTTYRMTVRAVYNAGESKDSNPIIASLSLAPVKTLSLTPRTPSEPTKLSNSTEISGLSSTWSIKAGDLRSTPPADPLRMSPHGGSRELSIMNTNQFHNQSSGNSPLSILIPAHTSHLDVNLTEGSDVGATVTVNTDSSPGGGEEGGGSDHMPSWSSDGNTPLEFANKPVGSVGPQVSLDEDPGRGHMLMASHTTRSSWSAADGSSNTSLLDTPQTPVPTGLNLSGVSAGSRLSYTVAELTRTPAQGQEGASGGGDRSSCSTERGEESGHMKPCPDKPTVETTSADLSLSPSPSPSPSPAKTSPSPSPTPARTSPSPAKTSLGPALGSSLQPPLPHSAGLQKPISTCSPIISSTSSPYLPPLTSHPPSILHTLPPSHMLSTPLSEPLLAETKQPPPFSTTDGPALTTLGGVGLEYTLPVVPRATLSESGGVDMYVHCLAASNRVTKVTDINLNTGTIVPPQTRRPEPMGPSLMTAPLEREGTGLNLNTPGVAPELSQAVKDLDAINDSDTVSSKVVERDEESAGGLKERPRCSGELSELAAGEARQNHCKQLPSDSEKCFEEERDSPMVPRTDSDSIISLAGATATGPNNTQGSSPLSSQTKPPVTFKAQPQGLGALMSEGVSAGGKAAGAVEGDSASKSAQMASVLLSQLESELTNSLNEGNT